MEIYINVHSHGVHQVWFSESHLFSRTVVLEVDIPIVMLRVTWTVPSFSPITVKDVIKVQAFMWTCDHTFSFLCAKYHLCDLVPHTFENNLACTCKQSCWDFDARMLNVDSWLTTRLLVHGSIYVPQSVLVSPAVDSVQTSWLLCFTLKSSCWCLSTVFIFLYHHVHCE